MKLTIETDDMKCTVESDAVVFDDLVQMFKGASVAVGFHHQTVEEVFGEDD